MKLKENIDYLTVKSYMDERIVDKLPISNSLRISIEGLLEIAEEQEKTINKLETEIKAINCMHGGFTLNNKELKKYILKDRLDTIVYSQQLLSIQISDLRKEIEGE